MERNMSGYGNQYGATPEHGSFGYPPQQRKRKIWPWVLAGVAALVVLACSFGALALGGTAHEINKETESRADAVTITSCKMDSLGMPHVGYSVKNNTDRAQDFIIQFNIVDGAGTVIGSATDIKPNVPVGATAKGDAIGDFNGDKGSKFKCVLTGA